MTERSTINVNLKNYTTAKHEIQTHVKRFTIIYQIIHISFFLFLGNIFIVVRIVSFTSLFSNLSNSYNFLTLIFVIILDMVWFSNPYTA